MLKDKEKHEIKLADIPNGHILIIGKSGCGKTYFACRQIEEKYREGKQIFIFDYSASYTLTELRKNEFEYLSSVNVLEPLKEEVVWKFRGNNMAKKFSDAIIRALGTSSFYQKTLLKEAILEVFTESKSVSIPALFARLEDTYFNSELDSDREKNVGHLLTRLEPYNNIEGIIFAEATEEATEPGINIMQISDYSEMERRFLTEILAEMYWQEVRGRKRSDEIVLFDEFQNMSMQPGGALSSMLREGRKFELTVYLASQFWGCYDREGRSTLMQVGNMIIFQPVQEELNRITDIINPDEKSQWLKILRGLRRGECVIKGHYTLKRSREVVETPLVCKVEKENHEYANSNVCNHIIN